MLEISPQNASYLSVPLRHSCSVTRRRLRGRITTPESTKKTLSGYLTNVNFLNQILTKNMGSFVRYENRKSSNHADLRHRISFGVTGFEPDSPKR